MLSDKSALVELINTVIEENSSKINGATNGHSIKGFSSGLKRKKGEKNYFSYSRQMDSIKTLERRVRDLEDQNDDLLYFIHFLYKNFPELVRKISPKSDSRGLIDNYFEQPAKYPATNHLSFPSLTKREIEILNLLQKGLCAKEIAKMLFISETTVITHKKNLKEKLNAKNTAELIAKAFTNGPLRT